MELKQIMTRDVAVVRPNAPVREAAEKMKTLDIGALPVCTGRRMVGMLTDRDITLRVVAEGRDPMNTRAEAVMTPDVTYCFEDQDVAEAAALMAEQQIRRLPIINRDKELVGILSLGDLAVDTNQAMLAGDVLEDISQPAKPKR
ncbi:MAG TPA: CBS domain-containing protein [Anaerolineae bacterium]|nr:CBS domain-containing protein [Anaerolineae bacterium]